MSCDKSWKMIERRVLGWIRKYDPNVVLLYRPKPTKRDVYPQVKYIASKRFLPFVASESVLQGFVNACTTELPLSAVLPASIREEMDIISHDAINMNCDNKRVLISSLVKSYMHKTKGIQRNFWGLASLTPPFWPEGVPFRSPNTCRNQPGRGLKNEEMKRVLQSYIQWREDEDEMDMTETMTTANDMNGTATMTTTNDTNGTATMTTENDTNVTATMTTANDTNGTATMTTENDTNVTTTMTTANDRNVTAIMTTPYDTDMTEMITTTCDTVTTETMATTYDTDKNETMTTTNDMDTTEMIATTYDTDTTKKITMIYND
ncbi:hypothetical protein DPMN_046660 [Dreissena polymorpha]|uniref:Uncharacterized protein n=2 Tax=Dreissena polymorpha TaxID=45954 RepID=A0A9D4DA05_DREPO|nr:hypothetical protein DPMN_046660 [Dreissena polymorpha]